MKKNIVAIFLLFLVFAGLFLSGCSKTSETEEPEIIYGVMISVYETKYNGNNLKKYPSKILTDTSILNIIEGSTGRDAFQPEGDIRVLYNLYYKTNNNDEIQVMIQNNGKVTFMYIGLPQRMYYLNQEEFAAVLEILE